MSQNFTYTASKCQGWVNPDNTFFGPRIINLSSYYSPAGATTLVTVQGANFYSYSSIVFGTYYPTVYFINSNELQFYVPPTLNSGTYAVQVFNGPYSSNIVTYNLDNSSGYWLLQATGSITNSNSGIVNVNALSRGIPIYINELSGTPYSIPANSTWFVCYNISSSSTIYLNLPATTSIKGREITIKTVPNSTYAAPAVSSITTNIVPLNNISPNNGGPPAVASILTGGAQWVTLVFDGAYWVAVCGA
jgi:hypothetical protein